MSKKSPGLSPKTILDNKTALVVIAVIGILLLGYFGMSALQKADLTQPVILLPHASIQEYNQDGTPNIYIHNIEANMGHVLRIQTMVEPDTSATNYRDANYMIIKDSLGNSYTSAERFPVGSGAQTYTFTINPVKATNFSYTVYIYRHYYPSTPGVRYDSKANGVYFELIEDECAYVTIPGDYCVGTTLYSNATCDDGVISYNVTLYSPICGFVPTPTPTPDPTEEPTATPTPIGDPTEEPTATPTPDTEDNDTSIWDSVSDLFEPEPTPEPIETPLSTPTESDEPDVIYTTSEEEKTNPILEFLQGIIDKIYELIR